MQVGLGPMCCVYYVYYVVEVKIQDGKKTEKEVRIAINGRNNKNKTRCVLDPRAAIAEREASNCLVERY